MELKDTISRMSSLSSTSSIDELPILNLLDKQVHEMTEEEKRLFVEELRSARVNSNVLINKIARESRGSSTPKAKKEPTVNKKLDVSDLL
jgi:uncharacterized protein YaaW (UPF0174 family)